MKNLNEICKTCGFTYGSHCCSTYYSNFYEREVSYGCCPTAEGNMDWSKLPETTFIPSGKFKGEEC